MLYSIELRALFNAPLQLFRTGQTLKAEPAQYSSGFSVDFGSANVNNKFTRQNKWFGSANKKAIFGALFQEFTKA
jgi:hypothetical protein